MTGNARNDGESAQAIIVVLTVLAVLFAGGIAFYNLAMAERAASVRYLQSIRSRYIAEAGEVLAQKILSIDKKANTTDSLNDLTFTYFSGSEAGVEDSGVQDCKWFAINDIEGKNFGRFAVKIRDEAAKVDINTVDAGVLSSLLSQLGVDSSKSSVIVSSRPFNAIEDIGKFLKKEEFKKIKDYITVYSEDLEIDLHKKRRVYLNSASYQNISDGLMRAGVSQGPEKALNLKDAGDRDVEQSIQDIYVLGVLGPTSVIDAGSWQKIIGFYQAPAGGAVGQFGWSNLPIEDGEYYCYLYGPTKYDPIGEVYIDPASGKTEPIRSPGDGLVETVNVVNGSFSLYIKPFADSMCRFGYVKLVSLTSKKGMTHGLVYGTEAVVINEIMVKPSRDVFYNGAEIEPGAAFTKDFTDIKPGDYYVIVRAASEGGMVGSVSIQGKTAKNLYDHDYFPFPVHIGIDGGLKAVIVNEFYKKSIFKGVTLSQEPDAEFIELLNISSDEIGLSDFYFDVYSSSGELVPGWPGYIPKGTTIKGFQHLVFAVDSNNSTFTPSALKGNGLSFNSVWNTGSIGLKFEGEATVSMGSDMFPNGGGRIILRTPRGAQVDGVKWGGQAVDYVSLERGDPTERKDSTGDGLYDGWYNSDSKTGATPGEVNNNAGMYTLDLATGKPQLHTLGEIKMYNRPLAGLQEMLDLSSGGAWKKWTVADAARMVDRFAYEAVSYDLSGHYLQGDFTEENNNFIAGTMGSSGEWKFTDVPKGSYFLSILSDDLDIVGEIAVSLKIGDSGQYSTSVKLLFQQSAALFGEAILKGKTNTLYVKVVNNSENKCSLRKIMLEPVYSVKGRLNINTASAEALKSFSISDGLVNTIKANRPIGERDARILGIGELFEADNSLVSTHKSFCLKSDVYEIISRGEFMPADKVMAYQVIRAVVDRGD